MSKIYCFAYWFFVAKIYTWWHFYQNAIKDLQPCTYKDLRILVSYWEETEESQSQGFGMAPEEFQKNFEKSLNISEKVNITEAKEASERMMRFMTQDADVVKFMTDMKFDYKDLHMVNNYFNKSS